jgi:hypothetical protein
MFWHRTCIPIRVINSNGNSKVKITKAILVSTVALSLSWTASAGTILIDDFTGGNDFNIMQPVSQTTSVSYTGSGPVGGERHIRISGGAHTGSNTTALDTSAGTLSTSILGYADTFVSYGTGVSGGSQLDLAVTGTASFEFDFDAFDLGSNHINGYFTMGFSDGNGNAFARVMSVAEMTALDVNGGGTASLALSSFSNFANYNGEIDGLYFGVDDRDFTSVVISEARLSVVTAPAPASGLLLALGLLALLKRRQ